MRLLNTNNAPLFWVRQGLEKRIRAFFGSREQYEKIPRSWSDYPLLCKNKNPETGAFLDYNALKDESALVQKGLLLNHGYDESKKNEELNIDDMRQAAAFRGGCCLSAAMETGNLYTPLEWECHNHHRFTATPFLVLKTGHWCPECCAAPPWNFDEAAKHIPFYAQLWYDDHSPDETNYCSEEDSRDILAYE